MVDETKKVIEALDEQISIEAVKRCFDEYYQKTRSSLEKMGYTFDCNQEVDGNQKINAKVKMEVEFYRELNFIRRGLDKMRWIEDIAETMRFKEIQDRIMEIIGKFASKAE